jgi:hypothetical protein
MADVLTEVERTIKSICKTIRKEGDCDPGKMAALSKLINSLSVLEEKRYNPYLHGNQNPFPESDPL